jgi:ABC-type transport system involved in multi-copper enzyme maturation permease subunit
MTSFPNALIKLAPGNPILLRVVTAGGRRLRHAFIRWGYLALLIGVLLITIVSSSVDKSSLSDLAKASTQVFKWISFVQLGMICLLAPIFTASAITQERDSQTYNILLATPLSNAQIVFGSLMSRLFFVIALLLSGVPVFAITLFYGGVTAPNIMLSFAIALTTGLFTGSLAITIAVFRLGTGKTVFWFYLFNAIFLVGGWMLDGVLRAGSGGAAAAQWLTGMHPFLALRSVTNPTDFPTPDMAAVASHSWLVRYYLSDPAYTFVFLTFFASLLFVIPSAIVLRRISQRSDTSWFQFIEQNILRRIRPKERRARSVWANPVAWREAATRAGASVRGITRWGTILLGLGGAAYLLYLHEHGMPPLPAPGDVQSVIDTKIRELADWEGQTRLWFAGIILLELSVSLLVATNTSASAVTRERESQTLDLLLVTPITSRYYIWGKLRGLVSFMLPFVAVPTLTVVLIVANDLLHQRYDQHALLWPEVIIEMPLFLTALVAFACMLGLNLSLKWSRTLVAVMVSVGALAGICAALGACGFAANSSSAGFFGLIFSAFSPFTGVAVLMDPTKFAEHSIGSEGFTGDTLWEGRLLLFISFLTSSIVYCLIVYGMYKSMVKNFDMIIRRQHQ